MGVHLAAQGFDGYWVDNGNSLVVTNFSLLASDAFASDNQPPEYPSSAIE
jgi:hypothetical protein